MDQEKQAYEGVLSAMEALDDSELERASINLIVAGRHAIQAGEALGRLEVKGKTVLAWLDALPGGLYDTWGARNLVSLGRAARYVHTMYYDAKKEGRVDARRRLPEELGQRAQDVRSRMLRVCSYYLEDIDDVARKLDEVRQDRSFDTLDSDLTMLARLYTTYEDIVSRDPKYYHANDIREAHDLSAQIASNLDRIDRAAVEDWEKKRDQIWTLLKRSHAQAMRGARFVLDDNEMFQSVFPSLYKRSRVARVQSPQIPAIPQPDDEG